MRYAFSRMNESEVFCGHGTDNTWDESVALVLQSLHLPWDFDQGLWNCRLTAQERERVYRHIGLRVEERLPLAYITNQAWFCGLEFFVDERVLVPRSPLSELIEQHFEPWVLESPERVLDLCTGSGCIGIAIASVFEEAEVELVDISSDALDVAEININRYSLQDRVRCIESDCFNSFGPEKEGGYDLIVSNPPYVDAEDIESMPSEYKAEPLLGLESGVDGLEFTRRMLKEAGKFLSDRGVLIAEVGNSWVALEAAFPNVPFTWLEFEHGGHGVFMLTKQQLLEFFN